MGLKSILKKIIPSNIKKIIENCLNGNYSYYLWILPIKKNKIVFCNYYGGGYGDNGKYIVKKLIEENLDCDIVWLVNEKLINKSVFPKNVRVVKYGSFKSLYELATAKLWIDNSRKSFYPPKRKNQYYIQTWHGGISLKQIEKDAENKLSRDYVNNAIKDSKMANLFISNSDFCTKMYKSAFWYDGDILECGSPRCDILINKDKKIKDKIVKDFEINKNSRILLYAPTFRNDENTDIYNIDFNKLIEVLEKKFGGVWNILVRLHPNIADKVDFMEYSKKIKNATKYDDMYELLAASDILITDYSSTMFEFSLVNKPVILYAPDLESYIEERNFYFDIINLPYPLSRNNGELFNIIEKFEFNKYVKNLEDFMLKLGIKERGEAAAQVVKIIKKIIY